MKVLKIIPFILLFSQLIMLAGCNTAPANRPTLNISGEVVDDLTEEEQTAAELAIEEARLALLARPDNAVNIENSYCVCHEQAPVSFGSNCESFCANTSSDTAASTIMYLDVSVTSAISGRTDLSADGESAGTFFGWCSNTILDDENEGEVVGSAPSCEVELRDSTGNTLTFNPSGISSGSNSLQVTLDGANNNTTYRVRIVNTDGNVSSDTVQIRLTEESINDPVGGPLETCLLYTSPSPRDS